MIIGYRRPKMTFTLTNCTAVTDVNRLQNGMPQRRARFKCDPNDGFASVKANFQSTAVGVVGFIGTDLPAGTPITMTWFGSTALTYTGASVVERRDGSRAAWWMPRQLDAATAFDVEVDTSALPADSNGDAYFEIGEIWASPFIEKCVTTSYQVTPQDFGSHVTSVYGQPSSVRRQQGAVHSFDLAPTYWANANSNPSDDLMRMHKEIVGRTPAVILPYTRKPFSPHLPDDQAVIEQRTAFGYFENAGTEDYSGGLAIKIAGMKFVEIPA